MNLLDAVDNVVPAVSGLLGRRSHCRNVAPGKRLRDREAGLLVTEEELFAEGALHALRPEVHHTWGGDEVAAAEAVQEARGPKAGHLLVHNHLVEEVKRLRRHIARDGHTMGLGLRNPRAWPEAAHKEASHGALFLELPVRAAASEILLQAGSKMASHVDLSLIHI